MEFRKKLPALLLGLLVASPALAGNFFCCPDPATGRRVCADTLPDQCKNRAYRIIDGNGTVIREVAAPMTPEQKALQEVEAKQKKAREEALREQRRKDAALLETYGSVQEIDKARVRAEAEVSQALKEAEKRIADAQKRRNALLQEAEFYKKREMPADLDKKIKDVDNEIAAQKGLLESKQQDMEKIRVRFADDRKRYIEISTGTGTSGLTHPAMNRTPAPAGSGKPGN